MPTLNPQSIELRLEAAMGLDFEVSSLPRQSGGSRIAVRPVGFEKLHGFQAVVSTRWHTVTATLVPDTFAADTLGLMSKAGPDQLGVFRRLSEAYSSKTRIRLTLDGAMMNPLEPDAWPSAWSKFGLVIELGPVELDEQSANEVVATAALELVSLVFALLPLEASTPASVLVGQEEGAAYETTGHAHERSPANRAACIALKGTRCAACGLDMGELYGNVGDGLIHVHHTLPVASMEPGHLVDIEAELFPLCPNCHAIAHRETPPISVERIAELVAHNNAEPDRHECKGESQGGADC